MNYVHADKAQALAEQLAAMASGLGSAKPECPRPARIQDVTGPATWLWGATTKQKDPCWKKGKKIWRSASIVWVLSVLILPTRVASAVPDIRYSVDFSQLIEIHAAPEWLWPALGFMAR
jgi:hypothetical protein